MGKWRNTYRGEGRGREREGKAREMGKGREEEGEEKQEKKGRGKMIQNIIYHDRGVRNSIEW